MGGRVVFAVLFHVTIILFPSDDGDDFNDADIDDLLAD